MWDAAIGEQLDCWPERNKAKDRYAVARSCKGFFVIANCLVDIFHYGGCSVVVKTKGVCEDLVDQVHAHAGVLL